MPKPAAAQQNSADRVAYFNGYLCTATADGVPINSKVIAAIPSGIDGKRTASMWNELSAERDALRSENARLREALEGAMSEVGKLRTADYYEDGQRLTIYNRISAALALKGASAQKD